MRVKRTSELSITCSLSLCDMKRCGAECSRESLVSYPSFFEVS